MDVYSPFRPARDAGTEERLRPLPGVPGSVEMRERCHFDPVHCRWIDEWVPTAAPEQALAQTLRCYSPADLLLLLEGTGLAVHHLEVEDERVRCRTGQSAAGEPAEADGGVELPGEAEAGSVRGAASIAILGTWARTSFPATHAGRGSFSNPLALRLDSSIARKTAGPTTGMPLNGLRTSRSLSPVTITSALPATATWRKTSSFGSRHAFTLRSGSTQVPQFLNKVNYVFHVPWRHASDEPEAEACSWWRLARPGSPPRYSRV